MNRMLKGIMVLRLKRFNSLKFAISINRQKEKTVPKKSCI